MGINYYACIFFGLEIEKEGANWYDLEEEIRPKLVGDLRLEHHGNNMGGGLRTFLEVKVPESRHTPVEEFNGDIISLDLFQYNDLRSYLLAACEELGLTAIGDPGWQYAEEVF